MKLGRFFYFIFSNIHKSIMAKMNIVISDEIESRDREAIALRLGFKIGNISKALEEAIDLWINSFKYRIPHGSSNKAEIVLD